MFPISSSRSNPNPKSTKFKRKKRKPQIWKKKKNIPNWVELPEEIWFKILSKLTTIDIIENAQKVCMLFRKLCKQPSMFKCIDMTVPDSYMNLDYDVNLMTRFAVDRSSGCLVDIYLEYLCDDETLMYIVERSKNLKHLRLGHYIYVSDEGLIEAVKKLSALEELEIIICSFSADTVAAIGCTCPTLRSFTLNAVGSKRYAFTGNEEALAIAKSMPSLRNLQLIGNRMTNEGLNAIIDGCPLLESLDLRACFFVDLSGALGKRCEHIRHLRQPHDSTVDYSHQATDSIELSAYNGYASDDHSGFFGF